MPLAWTPTSHFITNERWRVGSKQALLKQVLLPMLPPLLQLPLLLPAELHIHGLYSIGPRRPKSLAITRVKESNIAVSAPDGAAPACLQAGLHDRYCFCLLGCALPADAVAMELADVCALPDAVAMVLADVLCRNGGWCYPAPLPLCHHRSGVTKKRCGRGRTSGPYSRHSHTDENYQAKAMTKTKAVGLVCFEH